MQKTILLSLIVTSLVTGANTVTDLTINQQNEITSSSTIDNATVDQGKTEVLRASDVDNVRIGEDNANDTASKNSITSSSIKQTATDGKTTVSQGFTKIEDSIATDLILETTNEITKIDITNTLIKQGGFIVEGSAEVKDVRETKKQDLDAENIISNSDIDAGIEINGKTIKQSVSTISNNANAYNLFLQNKNKIDESTIDSSEIYQSNLKIDGTDENAHTTVTTLTIMSKTADTYMGNYILNSEIGSDSVIKQNDITIQNTSVVSTLISKTNNRIDSFKADKSLISQNEMFIDNSTVTGFTTTQTNEIIGAIVDSDYKAWSNTSDENRPEKTTISQGSTTIN
jgi:hypothetical protein